MNTIIVAGHAICKRPEAAEREESWILLDFQRGEVGRYLEHVRTGVALAAADGESLLVFAGGYSRAGAGPRSEGAGYYWIADHYGWWGHPEVAERAVTEEFSRDSFENLLFGICRTREFTGEWPERVSFVSWAFKRDRFELHREAIRWPAERWAFVGPNNPPEIGQALAAEARTAAGYRVDPYSSGTEYRAKREARNPYRRQHGYGVSCPEVGALLAWEGPGMFGGELPWTASREILAERKNVMVKNIINPEPIAPVVNSVEATEGLTVEISPTDQRFAEAQRWAHLKYAEAFRELAK